MSVSAEIIKNDFTDLVKSLEVGGQKYGAIKTTFLKLAVNESNNLREVLPQGASTKLKNSVYQEVEAKGLSFNGVVGARADYGIVAAETGRKPGSKVPAKELERWAQQKLGDKKLAYAVAKKIEKRGTRRYINKGTKLITQFEKSVQDQSIPKFIKQVGDIIVK